MRTHTLTPTRVDHRQRWTMCALNQSRYMIRAKWPCEGIFLFRYFTSRQQCSILPRTTTPGSISPHRYGWWGPDNRRMIYSINSIKTISRRISSQPKPTLNSASSPSELSKQLDHPSWYDEWKFLMLLFQRLLMGLGVVHCFTNYVMDITLCSGPSMLPTIKESNEIILIDRFAVVKGSIQDGTTVASRTRAAILRRERDTQTTSSGVSSTNVWNDIRMGVGGTINPSHQHHQLSSSQPSTIFTVWREILEHVMSPISIGDVVIAQNPNRPGTICKRILGLPGDQVIVFNDRAGTIGGTNIQIVPDNHVWLEGDNPNNSLDSRQSGPISLALLRGRAVARIWPLRGEAYLKRTVSPSTTTIYSDAGSSQCCSNSIVIPAGHGSPIIFGPMQQRSVTTTEKAK